MSEHFVRCVICGMIVPTEKTFVRDTGLTVGLEYTCIDCINKEKEPTYQQRLDKVLSKMNKVNDWYELKITIIDGLYLYYDSGVGLCLSWNDDGVWTYDDLPSLDTVESFLNDLEVE